MESLEGGIEVEGSVMSNGYREAKIEAPKPSMFKGNHDVQEVENFL